MAVIAQLAKNNSSLPWGTFPKEHREEFTNILMGFLVLTPICSPSVSQSELLSSDEFGQFIDRLSLSDDYRTTLTKLIFEREKLKSPEALSKSLSNFGELSDEDKFVVLVSLRDVVFLV